MDLKKVTKLYKETNLSTMPMVEYVLLLLNECLFHVRQYEENELNESISKAQKLLFELMALTDRRTAEGERLYTFYTYVNQCLVEVRINKSEQHLKLVQHYLEDMIVSWEDTKPVIERKGYQRQDLRL